VRLADIVKSVHGAAVSREKRFQLEFWIVGFVRMQRGVTASGEH